jgi:electron transfer flavoprotein-quinone oxidoreductase
MSTADFDVIVVGAGPAGTTAALLLARQGFRVALIERGEFPGAKNMFGGALFGRVLEEIIPEYWTKAPVERYINRKLISLITEDSAVSLDFQPESFKHPPYNGLVIRRAAFDRWYAEQAVQAGVLLLNRTVVEDVLWEDSQVVGVRVRRPGGEIRARAVIAADGALSLLARKAGLRPDFAPSQFSLGIKEVYKLPEGALRERFGLNGDEGLSHEYLGLLGGGLHGGAFLYTNRESLSVGVVVLAHSLQKKRATIYDALEQFKRHPMLAPLLAEGRFMEYSAHLIPEGGLGMLPKLYTGGMLVTGDAAGLVLTGGVFLEGVNLAIASGRFAAETVTAAFATGDFGEKSMSLYREILKDSFVLQDLQRFKHMTPVLMNERLYEYYPSMAVRLLEKWLTVDGNGHQKIADLLKSSVAKEIGLWPAARDAYQMGRALVW